MGLARLGVRTTLLGRVGNDPMGWLLMDHLDGLALGLLQTSVIEEEGGATAVAVQVARVHARARVRRPPCT